jgi:hypothetical protein
VTSIARFKSPADTVGTSAAILSTRPALQLRLLPAASRENPNLELR